MKRIICVFLSLIFVSSAICLIPTFIEVKAETLGYFTYENFGSNITITGYTVNGGAVSIPSVIEGKPVTSIGNNAFHLNNLTAVNIPNSVINIGDCAFGWCNKLSKVTIPSSVTDIGNKAFANNNILTEINVDINNPCYSSENGVLFDKSKTKLIQYPSGKIGEYIMPSSVTVIKENAFINCKHLTQVTIPDNVTDITKNTFFGCIMLNNVIILSSVTFIGEQAFAECNALSSVIILNGETIISSDAFSWCSSLVIISYADSSAKTYAETYGIRFCELLPCDITIVDSQYDILTKNITSNLIVKNNSKQLTEGKLVVALYDKNKRLIHMTVENLNLAASQIININNEIYYPNVPLQCVIKAFSFKGDGLSGIEPLSVAHKFNL